MSCVNRKPFSERFTFEGVKGFILMVIHQCQALFLNQKSRTLHPGGERLGERFFCYKYSINKNIYKPFTFHPYIARVFLRAYAREENGFLNGSFPVSQDMTARERGALFRTVYFTRRTNINPQ